MARQALQSPLSFFLPDQNVGIRRDADVDRYFPATRNWEPGVFYTSDLNAPYYIARAEKERAVIVGCSGLNTHYLLNPSEVKTLNQAGISIAWMALPKVRNTAPIMDNYVTLAKEFFTSRSSPAHVLLRNNNVPRFALTHSTGGQIFFHLLHDPAARPRLRAMFSAAVHVAPYFDTAHASRDHAHPLIQKIFTSYMKMKPDAAPNQRWLSGAYVRLNDFLEGKNEPHHGLDATCGQILELQRRGQELTANFNLAAARSIPSIFVLGDRDNFACPKSALAVAKQIGAQIEIARGGFHDPLDSHPQLLKTFIDKVDECARRFDQLKKVEIISPRINLRFETLPDLEAAPPRRTFIKLRGDGTGLIAQRSAGFLNASAGFFQHFG